MAKCTIWVQKYMVVRLNAWPSAVLLFAVPYEDRMRGRAFSRPCDRQNFQVCGLLNPQQSNALHKESCGSIWRL